MNCFVLYEPRFIGFIRTLKCQLTGSPAQLNLKHKENLLAHRITKSRCRPSEIQNLEDMVTGLHDLSPTFLLLWWLHLGAESPQNAPDPTTARPQRERPILTAPAGGPSGQARTQALPPQWGQPTSPQNLRVGGGGTPKEGQVSSPDIGQTRRGANSRCPVCGTSFRLCGLRALLRAREARSPWGA